MQIRRNTKAFKTILEIFEACQSKADRQRLIRLYITRAGHSIREKISVQGSKGEAEFFYDFSYQAVLNNLKSSTHQLYQSDDAPGTYFFKNNLQMNWDETPFEFDPAIVAEFSSLPELPTTKQKEKGDEFSMPTPDSTPVAVKKEKPTKSTPANAVMYIEKGPPPPDYKLKNKIVWTELDKVVYRQSKLSKRDVLDYYHRVSSYLLPYLKDRPLLLRKQSDSGPSVQVRNIEELPKKLLREIPSWVRHIEMPDGEKRFRCDDEDHLLLYVELDCVQFDHSLSKKVNLENPDFLIITFDAAASFDQVVEVARVAHEIIAGLKLSSFVKTDGSTGLHVYIPLDGHASFEIARQLATVVCQLIRLKIPNRLAIKGLDEANYGKVILDTSLNSLAAAFVAPYSLVAGNVPMVATPIEWSEVEKGINSEDFHHASVLDRLKKHGDLFEKMSKKKFNADVELLRLRENYGFLLPE